MRELTTDGRTIGIDECWNDTKWIFFQIERRLFNSYGQRQDSYHA